MDSEKLLKIKALVSAIDRFLFEDEVGDMENALVLSGMLINIVQNSESEEK